jgi:DNA-directed RNA polymerase subunit RPC12/RpoP
MAMRGVRPEICVENAKIRHQPYDEWLVSRRGFAFESNKMHTVICNFCKRPFDFDPAKSHSTSRRLGSPEAGTHVATLVQCPNCRHWMLVKLDDDDPQTEEWESP